MRNADDYLKYLVEHKSKLFVKGRYVDIVRRAYPQLNIEAVHDVEDAVVAGEKGSVGLEIVQTGSTLRRKNLVVLGAPLFLSESLYVVDYYSYSREAENINGVKSILDTLELKDFFDPERLEQFAWWYIALEKKSWQ